jgi:hypothetical protein
MIKYGLEQNFLIDFSTYNIASIIGTYKNFASKVKREMPYLFIHIT